MLPLNQKQINQYKWMRFGHLAASMLIIPVAFYYCKSIGQDPLFSLVASVLCLFFILYFRQYSFPPDLKGAMSTTLGLLMNFLFVFLFTNEGFLFSCYYIFFSFLCFQSLALVGVIGLILGKKKNNLDLLSRKVVTGRYYWVMALVILVVGSPLIVSPYFLGQPFLGMMNSLKGSDFWMMWAGIIFDLGQQIWLTVKSTFAKGYLKEINEKQNLLMKNLEFLTNSIFILAQLGVLLVMFL